MEILKSILGGEVGVLPTTYLGMPLGVKSNSIEIWDGVIEKCEKRLARWKSQYLSLGGRLTLINYVLDALPTYVMSLFPIPPGMINRLDSIRKKNLWQGNKERRGYHLVKSKTVITEKRVGGMGIKNMKNQSKALRMKWLWKYSNDNQKLWGSVIKAKYEESDSWMTKEVTTPYGVSLWKSIRELWNEFKPNTKIKVVDGIKTRFGRMIGMQKEIWRLFPDIHYLVLQQQSTIADLWTPQGWNFVFRRHLNDWEIPRVTEFFRSIDQFSGLEIGRDRFHYSSGPEDIYGKPRSPTRCLALCEVTGQLWNLFLRLKNISWSMPGRISEALYSWEEAGTQAKNRSNWRIVPATIWWTIWKEKNLKVFEDRESSMQQKQISTWAVLGPYLQVNPDPMIPCL
ncbi:hypothetical protein H5410_005395 [Solanum commersonii]|uniref:Uncharacterized protein n=1 Tax=Solanum commersonii TaxID=4109 RepID=A0A9J6A6L8_SOLCO|nr:hypothetical protein H5410_005395 [Solanum commersonii]